MEIYDLFEHRIASLYHGCGVASVLSIIARNVIEDRTTHYSKPGSPFQGEDVSGVSLSRSLAVAWQFGWVVLQLDWPKLAQRFKIEPIDYWGHTDEKSFLAHGLARRKGKFAEAEEFVVGPITQAMRYVTAIHIDRRTFHRITTDHSDQVMALTRHPLLRIDGQAPAMFKDM